MERLWWVYDVLKGGLATLEKVTSMSHLVYLFTACPVLRIKVISALSLSLLSVSLNISILERRSHIYPVERAGFRFGFKTWRLFVVC
jgi:hypothetical protein